MIAVAGWLIFSTPNNGVKLLWLAQLGLNGAWSWLFFGQHWTSAALLEIIVLVFVVLSLILRCLRDGEKASAYLLYPYLLWLLLATSLNAYIVVFN